MIYQDTWLNGKCVQKGQRECAGRYEIIKEYLSPNPPKSVLDIGANMCYFGLRLVEDFKCSVMAFEFNSFKMRKANVDKNKTKNLMFLERKISIPDLKILQSSCHFDLLIAMSVVHHLPGDTSEWISEFRKLAGTVIMEFALDDSDRPSIRKNYAIPADAKIIGYGDSHLKNNFKRPIIVLK